MLAAFSFLLAVAYWPGISGAATSPRLWLLLVAAPLMLAVSARGRGSAGHWLGTAFIAACVASTTWSLSSLDTINASFEMLALAALFLVGSAAENLDGLWLGLGLGAVVNVAIMMAQYLGASWFVGAGNFSHLVGTTGNRDSLAELCSIAAVGLAFTRHDRLGAALIAISLFGAFFSGSHEAMLALVAVGLIVATRGIGFKERIFAFATVGVLVLVLLWAESLNHARYASMYNRALIWDWTISNLHWFGWGLGTYGDVFAAFNHAHNDYLEFVFELGVLALPLFAVLGYAVGSKRPKAERHVLILILIEATVGFPLHSEIPLAVAALAAGRLCADRALLRRVGLARAARGLRRASRSDGAAGANAPAVDRRGPRVSFEPVCAAGAANLR